jgi:phage-related tail protein
LDENAKQYKRERIDEQTKAAQHNVGQASGDMMSSFEQGMEGIQEFVERNTESLRPQSEDTPEVSDTQSANYSKSSSEKSSQSSSKAKKKGGEGTGGSKSQFYAKK